MYTIHGIRKRCIAIISVFLILGLSCPQMAMAIPKPDAYYGKEKKPPRVSFDEDDNARARGKELLEGFGAIKAKQKEEKNNDKKSIVSVFETPKYIVIEISQPGSGILGGNNKYSYKEVNISGKGSNEKKELKISQLEGDATSFTKIEQKIEHKNITFYIQSTKSPVNKTNDDSPDVSIDRLFAYMGSIAKDLSGEEPRDNDGNDGGIFFLSAGGDSESGEELDLLDLVNRVFAALDQVFKSVSADVTKEEAVNVFAQQYDYKETRDVIEAARQLAYIQTVLYGIIEQYYRDMWELLRLAYLQWGQSYIDPQYYYDGAKLVDTETLRKIVDGGVSELYDDLAKTTEEPEEDLRFLVEGLEKINRKFADNVREEIANRTRKFVKAIQESANRRGTVINSKGSEVGYLIFLKDQRP